MGYAGFSLKKISRGPFCPQGGGGMGAGGMGVQKGKVAHGTSLAPFLIFCN